MKLRTAFRLIMFIALIASGARAAGLTGGFEDANTLYGQGKFAEAVAAYQTLLQSGSASTALYFNLGNAFFKSGQVGRALAAWRQAEALAPRDPDVRANLQFVRGQIQGPTTPPNRWQRSLDRLSLNEWTWLASVAFWIWLLALTAIQFRPAWKSSLRRLIWLSGTATALLAVALFTALSITSAPSVIVTINSVVHNGPIDESPASFTVHDGAELEVIDRKDDWLQVQTGDRRTGWVKREQTVMFPEAQTARRSR